MGLFSKKEEPKIEGLVRMIRNCALYNKKFKKEGSLYIFEDRIVFEPYEKMVSSGVFLNNIGFTIGAVLANKLIDKVSGSSEPTGLSYKEIARFERCKVMGINCCMKVITNDSSEMVFSLWPVRKEADGIIEMLNQKSAVN
jgi:hypothetical protein